MLVSMTWLRDFVDVPQTLSAAELADRFTTTCAEVERVEAIDVQARGLICAAVRELRRVDGSDSLRLAVLDVGSGRTVETVTAAPSLLIGRHLVFAPTGSHVRALGDIKDTTVAGRRSSGMILPGDAVGIALAAREAVFLASNVQPGTELDAALFDDWVIEIDNHSINNRPDLWGHYGIAREMAAMLRLPLKPCPVVPVETLQDPSLPEIPIEIDDPEQCPRYTGLLMKSVESRPGPLWMQLRLGHVGLRPIDFLVDLTNYIMLELGQPMHAFDGDDVDRIEVGTVPEGTRFTTLDNVQRAMPEGALMIMSRRRPVALAGIMGGANTEIKPSTRSMLLESANFNPYVIRRCANRLGHRTDASARFEKSLDPANTVLAVQRFVYLGKQEFANLTLASRLSDAYPRPASEVNVTLDPQYASQFMGHDVSRSEITRILTALEFAVADHGDMMTVKVPSFRATRDVSIEADLIEEIARFVGYNTIQPTFPEVSVRVLERNPLPALERNTLRLWTHGLGMNEVYAYLWYDAAWCAKLGYDPGECVTLKNPAATGLERLRQSLLPGLLAAAELNRHHFSEIKLIELGSAFPTINGVHAEQRHVGVLTGVRRKSAEDQLLAELKGAVDTWAWQVLARPAEFLEVPVDARRPWELGGKTAGIAVEKRGIGRIGAVPLDLRRRMDEHLAAWSFAWAEFALDGVIDLVTAFPPLMSAPAYPEVELDFSVLVDAADRFADFAQSLREFDHELLRRLTFVGSYEGKSVPEGKRSMTFRARIGDPHRTLVDADFSDAFGYSLVLRRRTTTP